MTRPEIEALISWNELQYSYTLHGADADQHQATPPKDEAR